MSEKPIDILTKYMGPLADMRNKAKVGKCPFCDKVVNPEAFRNRPSQREFAISGLCQECQDGFFDPSE